MDVNIAFACSVAIERQRMKRTTAYTKEKDLNPSTVARRKIKGSLQSVKIENQKRKMKFGGDDNTPGPSSPADWRT
jgi:hypothetical protein